MKKVVVTGFSGTLAPHLAAALTRDGSVVAGWDRMSVRPDDAEACEAFLAETRPDAVYHLGMGSEDWAALLAGWCHAHGSRFLFTSTAMVFADRPDGPHQVGDERTATDDYGRYKTRCEDAILAASPTAVIARIGWQIGPARGGNNMLEYLHKQHEEHGVIRASTRWKPACSFMPDTADALIKLSQLGKGVYQVDANNEGLTFYEIATCLNRRHDAGWCVEPTDDYTRDQRLFDTRVKVTPISDRL